MEVVVLLLQVVQTGVDLVQHGVDGSIFWKEEEREPRSCISPGLRDILPATVIPQPASERAVAKSLLLPEPQYPHLENAWISKEERLWRNNTLAHHLVSRVRVVRGRSGSVLPGQSCQVPVSFPLLPSA